MLLWVLATSLVLGSVTSEDTTFSPGCSFVGNKCMYTVKLGHAGQCDTSTLTPGTSSKAGTCCQDLSNKYSELKDSFDKLKMQVDIMSSAMASGKQNATKMEEELQKALKDHDDIVNVLNRKESELNSTKAELAKVISDAATKIQDLRNKLSSAQRSIVSCQKALGGSVKPGDATNIGTVVPGDYVTKYFNFNEGSNGFTFPYSSYGHMQIQRLHVSSSPQTGPRFEHSWGVRKGHYLGINSAIIASKVSSSRTTSVRTESDTFPPANAYCIMFWYFMKGKDVQTLTMNLKINGGYGYPVFVRKGQTMSHEWRLATVDLDNEYTAKQFKIEFTMSSNAHHIYSNRRTVTSSQYSDIAVDDLYVFNTTCASIPRYPSGAYQHTIGNVTSFYTFHSSPMTWTEAYDFCRRAGPWSALVSIESDAEQTYLVNTIKNDIVLSSIGQNGFYTSGTDTDAEHTFSWTNTGIPRDIVVNHWHSGQPNNVAGDQDCLLMEYSNSDYEWGDVSCTTKHPFICEVEGTG